MPGMDRGPTIMISNTFWHGKSVLVTGGSSGIGREACLAAGAAGARIGIIARRQASLEATQSQLRATGAIVETISCDVVDGPALRSAVTVLEDRLGPCDVAIACAGIHRTSWPLDAEAANTVIDVNVKGSINFISAVLPGMLARRRGHNRATRPTARVRRPWWRFSRACGSTVARVAFASPLPARVSSIPRW